MANNWIDILAKCKYNPGFIPFILAFLRIAICFWPQKGYLHPDEFHQSSNYCAGRYFQSKIQHVWEFETEKPIRNMLIPSVLNSIAFYIASTIQKQPSAYLLLVAPRLIYTLTTFIIDLSLYKLCQYYSSRGLWYLPISIIFQSSFICLGCLTRTFNNTIEAIILAVFLVVVCQTIRPTFRIYFVTPSRSTPVNQRVKKSKQVVSSLILGFLISLGIFNRPTFICFAFVPTLYWLHESWKRNSYNIGLSIQRVVVPISASALVTSLLMSTYDTIYYKGSTNVVELLSHLINYRFSDFHQKLAEEWVLTPYNFIRYNTNSENLSRYGLHPPYVHILVNIPLAFNILGLLLYMKTFGYLNRSRIMSFSFGTHRIYTVMLLTTLSSIILLSFIPHQEFRFLVPLIVPMTYVFSFEIYTRNRYLGLWIVINLVLFVFYGSIHQAGPIKASLDLSSKLQEHLNHDNNETFISVIAFRSYLVPSYLWNIPEADHRFHIDVQDVVDNFRSSLEEKFSPIMDRMVAHPDHKHLLYVMIPELYIPQLTDYLKEVMSDDDIELKTLNSYSLHFSGEEFQNSIIWVQKHGLSTWKKAFSFTLLGLDLGRYANSS